MPELKIFYWEWKGAQLRATLYIKAIWWRVLRGLLIAPHYCKALANQWKMSSLDIRYLFSRTRVILQCNTQQTLVTAEVWLDASTGFTSKSILGCSTSSVESKCSIVRKTRAVQLLTVERLWWLCLIKMFYTKFN